jgi:hypothetical protein
MTSECIKLKVVMAKHIWTGSIRTKDRPGRKTLLCNSRILVTTKIGKEDSRNVPCWLLATQFYNPSYLGGWDQENHSSRLAQAKSLWDPISTNSWASWHTSCDLEAKIGRIVVQGQPGQKSLWDPISVEKAGHGGAFLSPPVISGSIKQAWSRLAWAKKKS